MRFRRQKDIWQTKRVSEVTRSETEVCRIERKEYRGLCFIDIRIYKRSLEDWERFVPMWNNGIWIEDVFLDDVVEALVKAKDAPPVDKPVSASPQDRTGVVIDQIPATEREVYRITKGHDFVEIRRYMKIIGDKWRSYHTKGIVIADGSLEGMIGALKQARTKKLKTTK